MKTVPEVAVKAYEEGVPVFIITAKDKYAHAAIAAYKRAMNADISAEEDPDYKVSPEFAQDIEQIFSNFENWKAQNKKKVKIPT